jgi:hypothetical protein
LIFFMFSVVISRINETIASWTNLRHAGLEKALRSLLGSEQDVVPPAAAAPADGKHAPPTELSAEKLLRHPLVRALNSVSKDEDKHGASGAVNSEATERTTNPLLKISQGISIGKRKLSYLPARTFSAAVLDILAPPKPLDAASDPLDAAYTAANGLHDTNPAKRPLLRMITDARGDRDRFRQSLEHWYDDAMDRVGGWYKRNVQRIILVLSIVVVAALNVDTINIAQVLWRVPTERAAVASAAGAQAAAGRGGGSVDTQVRQVDALNLPIGWTPPHTGTKASADPRHFPDSGGSFFFKLLGMLISVLALSLGAPFWFDALGKLSGLSKSGDKPAKSKA